MEMKRFDLAQRARVVLGDQWKAKLSELTGVTGRSIERYVAAGEAPVFMATILDALSVNNIGAKAAAYETSRASSLIDLAQLTIKLLKKSDGTLSRTRKVDELLKLYGLRAQPTRAARAAKAGGADV